MTREQTVKSITELLEQADDNQLQQVYRFVLGFSAGFAPRRSEPTAAPAAKR